MDVVRQQYLDITLEGSGSEGFRLQQFIARICTNHLIPALEGILERYSPAEGHLYIDQLEIDLGMIDMNDLETKLHSVFSEKLETSIREIILHEMQMRQSGASLVLHQNVHFADKDEAAIESFFHFLHTGYLPWNYRVPEGKRLDEVISTILQHSSRDEFFNRLSRELHRDITRRRLAVQASADLLETIFTRLRPDIGSRVKKLSALFPGEAYTIFREKISEAGLQLLSARNENVANNDLFVLALKLVRSDQRFRAIQCADKIPKKLPGLSDEIARLPSSNANAIKDDSVLPEASGVKRYDESTAIYVDNAGLILLHPFLPKLFEATGMIKDGIFIDAERALYLLHYLVTGSVAAPEYELAFAKLLCGIPIDTPVSIDVTLLQSDMDEANSLLDAVIAHWSALQNTSHDGLRGTFLMRPGKISSSPDGDLLLQVETRTVDILLDQLPWGISMVKLSWMPRILRVEWSAPGHIF